MTPADDRAQPSLPRLPVSLARAAAPWKRPATATTELPDVRSVLTGWLPDRDRLAEYRALLGSSAQVPVAFPQIPVMAMHLDLISRWSFPVRALGIVHVGSVVEVLDQIHPGEPWDLRAWGSAGRHVRSGMEFDLWGEVVVDGRVRWLSRAVYLSRSRSASGAEESSAPQLEASGPWDSEVALPVPEGTGRAFARVSGDVNPIHLHSASARPFGFRRAIAPGWWTTGRAAALLGADECVPGRRLEVTFRRPVELPSTPMLCSRTLDGAVEFAVMPGPAGSTVARPSSGAPDGEDEGGSPRPLVAGRISG